MHSDPMEWVALSALPRVGAATIKRLLDEGWTPERVLNASDADWEWLGFNFLARQNLQQYQQNRGPMRELQLQVREWLRTPDSHLLTLDSPDYPTLLKQISDPPPILYVRGDVDVLHLPQIAMVGSRNASRAGVQHSSEFATALSQAGLIVTSGMAHGIDGAAHQAAVKLNKPTVAVFGTGADVLYPARHRMLAAQILETGGVWVSELPPGTGPLGHNFPRRNRIISGLSAGVLVVEAAPRSGSLITARQALEQGREVFALPGSLNNPLSQGCHALIREGGQLVSTVDHILEQLAPMLGAYASPQVEEKQLPPDLSAQEHNLLQALGFEQVSMDQLVSLTGIGVADLNVLLISLELKGLIENSGDGYCRI
ncbi:DNA-processing protein DprA [Pontibacterium sp.]|uniref:DNA-processing protein DprA n=1 Tax=Pontibacterium sp. TaxID=2036026 RepID=UPI003516CFF4